MDAITLARLVQPQFPHLKFRYRRPKLPAIRIHDIFNKLYHLNIRLTQGDESYAISVSQEARKLLKAGHPLGNRTE